MKNRLVTAGAALAALCAAGNAVGQCGDPYDATLCVYALTAAQVAEFSTTDGQVSAFWGRDWAGKDFADMVAPGSCYPGRCGFVGSDDASMKIKAAATSLGLYLYMEVMDNIWVDRANADDIGADATDIFIDRYDSDYLNTCTDCLIGLYGSMLSYTTNQFQVWMGASAPPSGFMFQYYDEQLWSWQALGYTWENAKVILGFEAEVITIDATHKAQEWFIPWSKLGTVGIDAASVTVGTKFGFAGGYNDKDGDNPVNDCLRWTIKDPWMPQAEANYWGNLQIAEPLNTGAISHRRTANAAVYGATQSRSEYYTLKGEKLSAQDIVNLPAGALTVKRTIENGTMQSKVVKVGR